VNLTKAFCVCMRPGARKVTGRPAFAALWRRAVSQSILSSLRKAEAISGGTMDLPGNTASRASTALRPQRLKELMMPEPIAAAFAQCRPRRRG
jgi:hypothetical protein